MDKIVIDVSLKWYSSSSGLFSNRILYGLITQGHYPPSFFERGIVSFFATIPTTMTGRCQLIIIPICKRHVHIASNKKYEYTQQIPTRNFEIPTGTLESTKVQLDLLGNEHTKIYIYIYYPHHVQLIACIPCCVHCHLIVWHKL